jgi:hypothetical protein
VDGRSQRGRAGSWACPPRPAPRVGGRCTVTGAATTAALLAAAAGWLLVPAPTGRRLRTAASWAVPPESQAGTAGRWLSGTASRLRRARPGVRRSEAADRAAAVVELAEVLAAELRAGQPPPTALEAALGVVARPVVPASVARAAAAGQPVADLLDAAAGAPGSGGLRAVAACWRVAEQSGSGLARGLERVVVGLRDEQQVGLEVASQLAAPRATGRLLALLPAFGWLLGGSLGAAPLEVLLTRPVGWACLAVGVPLQAAGWWWMERLAASLDPWR